ncbi:MAG TPA: hypothetical protein GX513_12625 [Firmicutes bacterium]|nr:hypothetical protein [Bacillota bacterium]
MAGVLGKVEEELGELREEVITSQPCQEAVERELGDVLFAAVNLARILNVDPEVALLEAVDRFSARFRTMEGMGKERGLDLTGMTMTELDVLWEAAKQQEGSQSCRIRSQRESRKKKGGSMVE